MDWISLLSAIGFSGLLTAIVGGWQNKRINKAAAENSSADYTQKILAQADARVQQALDDRTRMINERDDALAEAKGQRKAKQEWREKYNELQSLLHASELREKDLTAKLAEAEWHRCEANGCKDRTPPRKREQ